MSCLYLFRSLERVNTTYRYGWDENLWRDCRLCHKFTEHDVQRRRDHGLLAEKAEVAA